MKIISIDGVWYLNGNNMQDTTHGLVVPRFNDILNNGLPEHKYVCASGDDPNNFIVLNMLGAGFEDNFSIRIIKLPDPETDPIVVIYNIKIRSLADKFHDWLVSFMPEAKVIVSSEQFLPHSTIEKLLSLF